MEETVSRHENVLNKQFETAEKGGFSKLGMGVRVISPYHKRTRMSRTYSHVFQMFEEHLFT
jgi:hypothetical protein